MIEYDLIIVGGGASGLSAGVSALRNGIKNVLILERENDLGGNLNLFIHTGFGDYYLNGNFTGPELASNLIKDFKELGGVYKINTEVLEVTKNKVISYVNPDEGMQEIKSSAIILASGCREKFTGNINVPLHRYTGISTLVSSHKLINQQGYLPGKDIIIIGNSDWALIIARRLLIEGAKVRAVMDTRNEDGFSEIRDKIASDFNINIIKNHIIIDIHGSERIESIDIESLEDGTVKNLKCDSLILKVGYFPNVFFIRKANIELNYDNTPVVKNYETSANGIFACGTILSREKGILTSGENGYYVGEIVSDYLKKYMY